MDGEWIRGEIESGPVSDGPNGRITSSWSYSLTAPDGTEFHCNRTSSGYTSIHLLGADDYVAFTPGGIHNHTGKNTDPNNLPLLIEAGQQLYGSQYFGR